MIERLELASRYRDALDESDGVALIADDRPWQPGTCFIEVRMPEGSEDESDMAAVLNVEDARDLAWWLTEWADRVGGG
jgi:hypothetical protein